MILAYLILGHLLGDFVFQPTKLVMWKRKSLLGGAVHALVHFVINIIILFPFILSEGMWIVLVPLGISTVHFFIDHAKINYDLKHDDKVRPFIIDQMFHLAAILLAYLVIFNIQFHLPRNIFYQIYTDVKNVYFFSFLVFVTSVIEIYRYQKEREKDKKAQLTLHTNQMMLRVLVFSLIYILFMVLILLAFGRDAAAI